MSTIKGDAGVIFTGYRKRFDPGVGWTTVAVYQTGDQASADAFGGAQAVSGNTVDVDLTGPPYRIEVASPSSDPGQNEDYSDRWEITPMEIERPLNQNPQFQSLSADEQNALWRYRDDRTQENYDAALDAVTSLSGLEFLALIRKGTDQYRSFATGARWTRTVGDGFTTLGSTYANAGRIFSTGSLLSVGMPSLYSAAISAALSVLPSAPAGYASGWLKGQPSITQRGNSRSDIVQEWILENWSTHIYGSAV